MATMRPRTAGLGAARRQAMRAYNEPFTPNVVERDENEAHILQLELPEFNQQHVKVKVEEEARMVAVTGDRQVANNRLLILNKTYPIPESCLIDQIHHKLEAGFLTITMPKKTAAPAVGTAAPPKETEQTTPENKNDKISPENVAPVPKEPEKTNPEKGIEKTSPETAAPATQKTEQTTPEKESEKISPGNAAPATKTTEQPTQENKIEKISPGNAASATKKTEQTTPGKGSEEILPVKSTPPAKKNEITEEPEKEAKEEKALTPAPAVAPPPAAAKRDSGEDKTTPDEKMSSQNQNQTEKKEIQKENREKGKELKTEELGKNEETGKIGAGASPPRATRVRKFAGRLIVGKTPLPVTASLTAAVVITVAAYFALAYYGLSLAME